MIGIVQIFLVLFFLAALVFKISDKRLKRVLCSVLAVSLVMTSAPINFEAATTGPTSLAVEQGTSVSFTADSFTAMESTDWLEMDLTVASGAALDIIKIKPDSSFYLQADGSWSAPKVTSPDGRFTLDSIDADGTINIKINTAIVPGTPKQFSLSIHMDIQKIAESIGDGSFVPSQNSTVDFLGNTLATVTTAVEMHKVKPLVVSVMEAETTMPIEGHQFVITKQGELTPYYVTEPSELGRTGSNPDNLLANFAATEFAILEPGVYTLTNEGYTPTGFDDIFRAYVVITVDDTGALTFSNQSHIVSSWDNDGMSDEYGLYAHARVKATPDALASIKKFSTDYMGGYDPSVTTDAHDGPDVDYEFYVFDEVAGAYRKYNSWGDTLFPVEITEGNEPDFHHNYTKLGFIHPGGKYYVKEVYPGGIPPVGYNNAPFSFTFEVNANYEPVNAQMTYGQFIDVTWHDGGTSHNAFDTKAYYETIYSAKYGTAPGEVKFEYYPVPNNAYSPEYRIYYDMWDFYALNDPIVDPNLPKVSLLKVDQDDNPLTSSPVTFDIYTVDANNVRTSTTPVSTITTGITTSVAGITGITNEITLPEGRYEIYERDVPSGYVDAERSQGYFVVEPFGTDIVVTLDTATAKNIELNETTAGKYAFTAKNYKNLVLPEVSLIKVDQDGNALTGTSVAFDIYPVDPANNYVRTSNTPVATLTTDPLTGITNEISLDAGNYEIIENNVPLGYDAAQTSHGYFKVENSAGNLVVAMDTAKEAKNIALNTVAGEYVFTAKNIKNPDLPEVSLIKVDQNNNALTGTSVAFDIYTVDPANNYARTSTTPVTTLTTDPATGITNTISLGEGNFEIIENNVPVGYDAAQASHGYFKVENTAGNLVVAMDTAKEAKNIELNETSAGKYAFTAKNIKNPNLPEVSLIKVDQNNNALTGVPVEFDIYTVDPANNYVRTSTTPVTTLTTDPATGITNEISLGEGYYEMYEKNVPTGFDELARSQGYFHVEDTATGFVVSMVDEKPHTNLSVAQDSNGVYRFTAINEKYDKKLPPDPTDPIDPTNPTNPTDPADPDPSDPTDPSYPSYPPITTIENETIPEGYSLIYDPETDNYIVLDENLTPLGTIDLEDGESIEDIVILDEMVPLGKPNPKTNDEANGMYMLLLGVNVLVFTVIFGKEVLTRRKRNA